MNNERYFRIYGVTGIAMHPKEPYILTSLKNGNIKLWDYRTRKVVREFNEHTKSVWGIDFHSNKPIFVSGGDDLEIKVWNYNDKKKNKRSLFTLKGHEERINTTFFHNKYPWIVSASNDKTIRIWDWKTRTQISKLMYPSSSVTCAQFHNMEDWVIVAPRDENIQLLSIYHFRSIRRNIQDKTIDIDKRRYHLSQGLVVSSSFDGSVKTCLIINICRFAESNPMLIYYESSYHFNLANILYTDAVLLSTSLDRSIRVFTRDIAISLEPGIRELAAHLTQNIFADGGKKGFAILKFERDRSPITVYNESLYYIKDDAVHRCGLDTEHDESLPLIIRKKTLYSKAYSMAINDTGDHVIIVYRGFSTGHFLYHLYSMPIDNMSHQNDIGDNAFNAVWVSHDQFAVLEESREVTIRGLDNEVIKTLRYKDVKDMYYAKQGHLVINVDDSVSTEDDSVIKDLRIKDVKDIYYAKQGHLVIKVDGRVIIYNVEDEVVVASIVDARDLHLVVWSMDWTYVALLSKTLVQICDQKLIHEGVLPVDTNIKSGCWTDDGVFLYSTSTDLRYITIIKVGCQNKHGTIRQLDKSIYLTRIRGNRVWFIDRGGSPGVLTLTDTEFPIGNALVRPATMKVPRVVK